VAAYDALMDVTVGARAAHMKAPYRERWKPELAKMRHVLAGLGMTEECKWGKPCYTVDGNNVVILQDFK